MTHAYDEMYLEGAMTRMGDMLEYVTLDLGIDSDVFFKMFLESKVSRQFENGDVSIISGKSGPEIANIILEEIDHQTTSIEPTWREDRSDIYWSGSTLAYFQWYVNHSFDRIWKDITIRKLRKMYPSYHEVDITKTVDAMERMLKKPEKKRISELRILKGWTQEQLAEEAEMSVSQLQRLEYGERSTSNLTLKTAIALAHALSIDVESLLDTEK